MHFSRTFVLSSLALLASTGVQAQDLSQLPTCAQTCAIGGISSSGCGLTDLKCICSATAFLNSMGECVNGACSPEDVAKTLAFAQSFCASVGVTIPASSAPASTTAAAETTAAPKVSITKTNAPLPTGNATAVATAPPFATFTGAAGSMKVGSWFGGLAAVAGLVFAL